MWLYFFQTPPSVAITNPSLLAAIDTVRNQPSADHALTTAFSIVEQRFKSYRFRTYFQFWQAFENDPNVLWGKTGFLHCHHQNYLLRLLLIESGHFTEADIELGHSLVWFISIHQYLKVKVNGRWLAADPWNSDYGATLGEYASGFRFKKLSKRL